MAEPRLGGGRRKWRWSAARRRWCDRSGIGSQYYVERNGTVYPRIGPEDFGSDGLAGMRLHALLHPGHPPDLNLDLVWGARFPRYGGPGDFAPADPTRLAGRYGNGNDAWFSERNYQRRALPCAGCWPRRTASRATSRASLT